MRGWNVVNMPNHFVESGNLYTFGEAESGKLGHGEGILASEPLEVEISDKVVWASCGGRHTVAVTGV